MKNIDFSMTYLALKMFGKQLYANISAAIAELVANGLDAKANSVYVYMDITNKEDATVIIFDDGKGMSEDTLETEYAVIGRNKRQGLSEEEEKLIMGRKGIGKLAALYLSDTYTIITKQEGLSARAWRVDVSTLNDSNNNETPQMVEITYPLENSFILQDLFDQSSNGTLIYLDHVKLKRFGEAAAEALEHKLANYFLVESLADKIKLCIKKDSTDEVDFNPVKKNIAFGNMAYIYSSDDRFEGIKGQDIKFSDNTLVTKEQIYTTQRKVERFPKIEKASIRDEQGKTKQEERAIKGQIEIDGKSYDYELKGWIGVHCSIEKDKASLNCDNFQKNLYYNPNQLRVYVRNKLATADFLSYLGMTAALLNYIEGEISFDILDVEGLEDITTAGRDNFSVQDERVKLLIVLCKGIVSDLVRQRQAIADDMKEHSQLMKRLKEQQDREKIQRKFTQGQVESKKIINKLPKDDQKAIESDFTQFTRACNSSNETSTIFISHKKDCENFGNFLISVLIRVFPPIKYNIIFTSNSDYGVPQGEDICEYLSSCFRDDLHVVFLFSRSFYDSNVCLAEAGAAWGTNKKYSNFVIDLGFSSIDKPINSGQKGAILVDMTEDSIKDFAKEVIRILKSVGVSQDFDQDAVIEIINDEYEKQKDGLIIPLYKPLRRFQAAPVCPNCNHTMQLEQNDTGYLYYNCLCGNKITANIVGDNKC